VGEGHGLSPYHRHLVEEVFGADPVKGQVRERGLGSPAERDVQVVYELLEVLANLLAGEAALPDVDAVISLGASSRFDVVFGDAMAKMLGVPGPVVAVFQPFAGLGMTTACGV